MTFFVELVSFCLELLPLLTLFQRKKRKNVGDCFAKVLRFHVVFSYYQTLYKVFLYALSRSRFILFQIHDSLQKRKRTAGTFLCCHAIREWNRNVKNKVQMQCQKQSQTIMSRMKSTFWECNNQRTWRVQQNAAQVKLYYGLGSSNKKVLLPLADGFQDWDTDTVARCNANVSFTASNSADNGGIKRI